ncbi:MAG: amidohydrolase [Alphaproteobacteria bacterium]|nr:amidohydrolase [Alphaproteobacteria bacterium]
MNWAIRVVTASALTLCSLAAQASEITIFTAKKIITMEESLPEATAVAVTKGKIVSVGSLESLNSYVETQGATVDRQFESKILMPGFIDPHIHPSLPAVLTQFAFLAPEDWELPTGDFPGAVTHDAYIERLTDLVAAHVAGGHDPSVPFVAWGYHPLWHGEVKRPLLNALFPDTPVMLWHRSFHEIIGNDAAFELLGITEADAETYPHEANWPNGHFWENGAKTIVPKMPFLFAPDRYGKGMENFYAMLRQGGVTSAMDMGIGIFGDPEGEIALIKATAERLKPSTRLVLTPIITDFLARGKTPAQALDEIRRWTTASNDLVMFDSHFKLMMDGAIFSGLAQYDFPGYKDGHEGLWMAPLEVTEEWARFFWNRGFQIHAHTNGDKSAAALITMVRRLLADQPRFDHRTTLEHFAFAHEDQLRQMAALGISVSANPYYQHILADAYAENWLNEDIARYMVPLGAALRHGIVAALHSDNPMAPLSPLKLVETAVNRTTINGQKNAAMERISVHQALRAVTIDAAWIMRWEDRIGSIRAGKFADFVVLEDDPYSVAPDEIAEIPVWGTVFEGKVFPSD